MRVTIGTAIPNLDQLLPTLTQKHTEGLKEGKTYTFLGKKIYLLQLQVCYTRCPDFNKKCSNGHGLKWKIENCKTFRKQHKRKSSGLKTMH